MKHFHILILFLLFSINGYACKCFTSPIHYKFTQADFVGKIIVKKIYTNKGRERYYKADIEIKELYKGNETKSIYIHGNNGRDFNDSCDIFIDEGQEVLVYLKKHDNGSYYLETCSEPIFLNKADTIEFIKKRNHKKIQILRALKSKNIDFTNTIKFSAKDLDIFLRSYRGIELNTDFAIYEVTFKENLKVKCVQKVRGFQHRIDRKIKKFLKHTEWASRYKGERNSTPNNSKYLVIIYYGKSKKNSKGYLSDFFR
ncbi:hypothetical protein [Kordia jejudonensis]|uniref:hypothetical protein n=1 Tax=Kordia jejudonensis TaxID=1348245 RepID=UPI0006294669|nr:hypothetical protein [Kordia jejudonensis]